MAKITIIIPVYNGMPYLSQCLNSVMNQTLKDFDVVIVDDGSTDETSGILREYTEKYKNIKVITQINKGLYAARKIGLAAADGEYIGWIDADDFIAPEMYEKMYDAAKKNNSDLVYCDYTFYPQKIATKEKWFRPYVGKRDVDFVERNSQPWNKIVRRDLLEKLDIGNLFPKCFDEAYIKVLIHANKPVSLNEKLYYYRIRSGSMSSSYKNVNHYEKFIDSSKCLKKALNEESQYWQDYFDYRVIYYTLMSMLVAAHANDKQEYYKLKSSLKELSYRSNQHLNHILKKNFGSLKAFAIKNVIPMNYSVANLLGRIAFKI